MRRRPLVLGVAGAALDAAVFLVARRRARASRSTRWSPSVDFALLVLLELVAPETLGAVRAGGAVPHGRPRPFPGRAARPGGGGSRLAGARGGHRRSAATQPVTGDVLAFYEAGVRALRPGHRARGRPAAHSRVGVAAAGARPLAAHDPAGRERGAPPRGRVDPRRAGSGADRTRHDPVRGGAARPTKGGAERAPASSRRPASSPPRNVRALRDEIVDLGPYAFQELSFDTRGRELHAGMEAALRVRGDGHHRAHRAAPEIAGDLFRIAQEAVVNAGRHAEADTVSINLRTRRPPGGAARDRQRPRLR